MGQRTNKSRPLFLLRYLVDHTDEDHQLTVYQIIDILKEHGFGSITRKTITEDIRTLNACGFDIFCDDTENAYSYFYNGRLFQLPEVKLLIDAVSAASFIKQEKRDGLITTICSLAGPNGRKQIQVESMVSEDVASSPQILYVTDAVQEAIVLKKKIRFQYADYDENRNRFLRHNGDFYEVSPYHTYFNDSKYYMIGYYERRGAVNLFRQEFMENVTVMEDSAIPEPEDFSLPEYLKQTFIMYPGEPQKVILEVENGLMRKIIDKFGTKFNYWTIDEKHFQAEVVASVSETFFSWLFLYDGGIKLISPPCVCNQYEQMLQRALTFNRE